VTQAYWLHTIYQPILTGANTHKLNKITTKNNTIIMQQNETQINQTKLTPGLLTPGLDQA